ncbi:hypothetical protein CONLIGDRAFT_372516 [Coniochaeta ligniaria NRRL 30616]|uniref:Uncharacterized protein n=1 Tax=Coniochaeta ligniaria NRRL 30616 TaxID=1408157 RepID=A0A1J7ILH6_9PEZI|nr:hypothetical protein CONLIGDRAFT_372516 [Coniochaeta ligniaria NRRL 30616]
MTGRKVQTVQEHLFPEVVKLQLVSRDGHFEVIEDHHTGPPLEELKPITHSEPQGLGFEDISSFLTYPASEILLLSGVTSAATAPDMPPTSGKRRRLSASWTTNGTEVTY